LPYGPQTLAYFLKPEGARRPLPGILGLHDHGGVKYFGKRKIARSTGGIHPHIREHQKIYYDGRAWANELARHGYGVLVHDVFPFASRRIQASGLPAHVVKRMMKPPEAVEELNPEDLTADSAVTEYDVSADEPGGGIHRYDAFAAQHEHIVAKSLFSAGTTWPGLFLCEDLLALEVLANRPDIDSSRLGCGGLSGGGLRTNYLAGLDDRIRCAVSVGFMSTWRDFVLNISYTHTWMLFIPLLPRYLELAEVLGMRIPLPTLVQCNTEDPLYTLGGMQRATDILSEVYAKADASQRLQVSFFKGPHRFSRPMQNEAFAWFDRWLKQ
jgi:dienelactone hydrolase